MWSNLQPFAMAVSVGSLLIAATALAFSAINTLSSSRSAEISSLFGLWSNYEKYSSELKSLPKDTSFEDARIPFINMANFIENLSLIYNRGNQSSLIRKNILAIVTDFFAVAHFLYGDAYQVLLEKFGFSSEAFKETKKLCSKHRKIIEEKTSRIDSEIYGESHV